MGAQKESFLPSKWILVTIDWLFWFLKENTANTKRISNQILHNFFKYDIKGLILIGVIIYIIELINYYSINNSLSIYLIFKHNILMET